MRDEIDAQIWLEYGAGFSEDLDRSFGRLGAALKKLDPRRRNFWKRRDTADCHGQA